MDVIQFCSNVVTLRAKWIFSVTSWGRSILHNKNVGGVPGSDHLLWLGLDVLLEPMEKNLDFETDCVKVGLVALFEKGHYHLSPR